MAVNDWRWSPGQRIPLLIDPWTHPSFSPSVLVDMNNAASHFASFSPPSVMGPPWFAPLAVLH